LLGQYPNGFDEATSRRVLHETRPNQRGELDGSSINNMSETADLTPDERIDAAYEELRAEVASELLEQILRMPPESFEKLVLSLLHGLGYGASEDDLQRVGGPGDGGIDGIVSLDRLGFEKIYVQAKRWQGSVGRPDIQAFYGALAARQAKKGVYITSSTFTREAREFAGHVGTSIVLIDGNRLTSLMIECGVAVAHYRIVRLPRVDLDFFDLE
jgi:restriction system protein